MDIRKAADKYVELLAKYSSMSDADLEKQHSKSATKIKNNNRAHRALRALKYVLHATAAKPTPKTKKALQDAGVRVRVQKESRVGQCIPGCFQHTLFAN